MALDKQIHLYSIDTSVFYNKKELKIHRKINKMTHNKNNLKRKMKKLYKNEQDNIKEIDKIKIGFNINNHNIKLLKEKLKIKLTNNNNLRYLNPRYLNVRNLVSMFDSDLSRTMNFEVNKITTDIFIVQTYYFEVIEDIIIDGFIYNNEKYICLTASAGQIRTKKTVFIKESLWNEYKNSLMCGLTIEHINSLGGVNVNKLLAYLALCNSATDEWTNFNIKKCIIVDDFETFVKGNVDYIDNKTYTIHRQIMQVPITHTDGCGMILPQKSKKSFMVRLPWVKGLLIPFSYDIFIKEANERNKGNNCGIIKDIYGVEHDIIDEGIEVIFTKSQFKMWKYYESWENYINNFIKFNCKAAKCNEEEDNFNNAKINYQMLQTLTDISDKELTIISKRTLDNIKEITSVKKSMMKLLGVTKANTNKNYLQKSIEIYPNLLRDVYTKQIINQTKNKLIKEGKSGKLELESCFTFICPDLYAFCEYLFLGIKDPCGLLENKDVYCNIYKDKSKLACLRSPHLFFEWAIRNNIIDNDKKKWFITNGVYTSCHDLISKILQFDVDGDKSLVVADPTIIGVAERNSKNIVPLYYNMAKSNGVIINSESIYKGLIDAYTGGNIGLYSNNISKIWNSEDVNLDVIKLLCMENNFTIDYAKTLYKPKRPSKIDKLINKYTRSKVPHFFIYAKDKNKDQVEVINNSTVNRLEKIIKNCGCKFSYAGVGKFDYRKLDRLSPSEKSHEEFLKDNKDIIDLYIKLDLRKYKLINNKKDSNNFASVYQEIRDKILQINSDIYYVVSVLVEYLYNIKKEANKTTLWESFGDILVDNLKYNIDIVYIYCEKCGDLIEKTSNKQKYCDECAKEIQFNQKKNWDKTKRIRKIENP